MMNYEKVINNFGDEVIQEIDENGIVKSIPTDPANSDYQAYLKSSEEPAEK